MRRRSWRIVPEISRLKESAQECCRFIRDANDLIRCLAIKLEIEFRLGAILVPVAKMFQLAAPEAPLGQPGTFNSDANPRRLPDEPWFLRNRFCRSNNAARNETGPTFVLTRKDKDRITLGNVLPTIHGLLSGKGERSRPQIANRRFDRKRHFWKRH